jgi:3-oxoacyl-[acyl-carrier protein] reductase
MSKVIIVTGSTKGIGKSIAKCLCDKKNKVVICARCKVDLDKAKFELEQLNDSQVLAVQCDVSIFEEVQNMISQTISHFGCIDALVNNAGIAPIKNGKRSLITDISLEQWDQVISINLTGAFYCSKTVVPYMIKQKKGKIINISSASAIMGGIAAGVDYISSKSGIIGLTKGLAYELGQHNITANAITPGRVKTDMLNMISIDEEWAAKNVPLKRLGIGEDIGKVVSFLISDDSDYITGATIDVNGGWVIY